MSLGSQFGLLPSGFVPKSIDDVTKDLQAAFQQAFGASIDVQPESRFGQIIGIMAERYAELWGLAVTVDASFNPDDATGISLVNLAGLTGTLPLVPTPSTVTETATGTNGTVLNTGRVVAVSGTGSLFQTTAPATLVSLTAWAQSTNYVSGNRRSANGNSWQCIQSGTSLNSGTGPTGAQGTVFTDNTCKWLCLGTGTAAVDVPMSSQANGPIVAVAGTLTQIQTPVAGWNQAYNVTDALLGIATESDALFRARREAELHGIGKAAVEAIRSALLKLTGVTAAIVFENVTDVVNSDGMPPHSVEAMLQGGVAADIANSLFTEIAAGIATTGNQAPVTVTDSQGITHSILYSRPTLLNIWVTVNAIVDPTKFPVNGVQQIINNLLSYGQTLVVDLDVISSQLAAAVLNGVPSLNVTGVPGVLDSGTPLIGLVNPPVSSTTVPVGSRQLAVLDSGRIVVNITNGSP